MQDSITMAEVGSMVKVSGSRIATPFGPPSPGSTPTKMPSTSPIIIRARIFQLIRTAKPCRRRPNDSMELPLPAEGRFERSLRHDDVERDIESHEHDRGENDGRQQRFPQRDLADRAHEGGDQHEARDIDAEILNAEAEQQRRHEYQHDATKLGAGYKDLSGFAARKVCGDEAI